MKKILLAFILLVVKSTSFAQKQNFASQCYRGNVELGYLYNGGGSSQYSYAADMVSINTSHGYLFKSAGLGINNKTTHRDIIGYQRMGLDGKDRIAD